MEKTNKEMARDFAKEYLGEEQYATNKEAAEHIEEVFQSGYAMAASIFQSKAEKWDKLDEEIADLYPCDDDGNQIEDKGGDLCDVGEAAARAFGYM